MWLSRRRCRAPVSCIEASVRGEVRRDRVPSGYHSSRNCFPELLPGEVHLQGSLTRFQTRESRPAFLFLLVVVAPCALAYFPVQILSPSVALLRFPGVGCAFFSAGVSPGSVARFFHLGVALLRSGW